jgi:hypothetical protein
MKTNAHGHVEKHDPDRRMIALRLPTDLFLRVQEKAIREKKTFNCTAVEIIDDYISTIGIR